MGFSGIKIDKSYKVTSVYSYVIVSHPGVEIASKSTFTIHCIGSLDTDMEDQVLRLCHGMNIFLYPAPELH